MHYALRIGIHHSLIAAGCLSGGRPALRPGQAKRVLMHVAGVRMPSSDQWQSVVQLKTLLEEWN